jgi:hypothetical protein
MKAVKKNTDPSATELIEEAVHLLRTAPPAAWVIYLAGAVPWVLGLGHFWATASWFAPRPETILWRALGLAALFLWLKVAQAEFCRKLRAVRFGEAAAPLSWRGLRSTAGRQAQVQGWALPLLPIAGVLTLPAAATWMFFENVTALAASPDAGNESLARRAWREALRWPGPAHVALLLFSGVWLCVWINIATVFYAVPWLARSLLGLDNMFGLSGWSVVNSTLLALVTILTWLAVDPLVKAYHVLRTFYGEARHTGEDLSLELRRPAGNAGVAKAARLLVFAVGLCAGMGLAPEGLRAAEAVQTSPAQVDNALDEALKGRDFRWSLQPLPSVEDVDGAGVEDGLIKGFIRQGVEVLVQVVKDVYDAITTFVDWLKDFGGKNKDTPRPKETKAQGPDMGAIMRGVLYVLLGLCLLTLIWILWVSWKKKPVARRLLSPMSAMPAAPDLNDEKLEASRLPSHEWLELARTQLARGEWRLALRALYLCSLANLAAQGLVSLARAKTNLDYEHELARRAAGRTEVVTGFRARRLSVECVWYGREYAEADRVRAWLAELEREEGQKR